MSNTVDMARLMGKQLPRHLMAFLIASGVQGNSHGYQVYLVGGMVRDVLLNRRPGDPDLLVQETVPTMDAAPRFAAVLADALGGSVSTPSQFGTVKLDVDGLVVDIATARRETYESPGALPSVRPATIEGDQYRRDFTVNAIAVDLAPNRFGTILDHAGGVEDIEHRVLAVLHDKSFADDPTRCFRAARYMPRLGLRMSMVTETELRRSVGAVAELSGDRVRHELERIFDEAAPEQALANAEDFGLLNTVLPGLSWSAAMSRSASALRDAGPLGCLALLATHLSEEDAAKFSERINAPAQWASVIEDTVAVRTRLHELSDEGLTSARVYSILGGMAPEAVRAWALLTEEEVTAGRLRDYYERLRHVHPALNGDDLLALGVPQGPLVGELLRELLIARLNGAVSSRGDEESLVQRRLSA